MRKSYDEYTCTLSRNRLLYFEMRTVARMMYEIHNQDQIRQKILDDNIFQYYNRDAILKSIYMVFDRLAVLDDVMREFIAKDNSEKGKLVSTYAVYKTDRLFREFLSEFVHENLLKKTETISYGDLRAYFQGKREQSVEIAQWSDRIFKDLRGTFLKILVEIEMLSDLKKRLLAPIVIPPDLTDHLSSIGEKAFIRCLTGGRS